VSYGQCGVYFTIPNFVFRYKSDPQITAMTDLVDAYQRREVHSAEKILRGTHRVISRTSTVG
jgi:hypothetical protein